MKYPYLDKVVESRLHSNIYIYRIINTLFNHIVTIVLIYLVVATFALILGRLAASDVSCSSQIPILNQILFDPSGIHLCLPCSGLSCSGGGRYRVSSDSETVLARLCLQLRPASVLVRVC